MMKRFAFARMLLVFLLIACAADLKSQENRWTNTVGPNVGGALSIVAGTDGLVFAVTDNGVYRSSDHGKSWAAMPSDVFKHHIEFYYLLPNKPQLFLNSDGVLFLKTGDGCLFRSENNGDTWSSLDPPSFAMPVKRIVGDRTGNIFILADSTLIFRSSDNGDQWNQLTLDLPISDVDLFIADSSTMIVSSADTIVYRSTDAGESWTSIGNVFQPKTGGRMLSSITPDGTMFVARTSTGGVVFRSTDRGVTWTCIFTPPLARPPIYFRIWALASNLAGDVAFMGYSGVVYRSTDNGASWWQQSPGTTEGLGALAADANGDFFVGAQLGGMYRMPQAVDTLELLAPCFALANVNALCADGAGGMLVASEGGIYRSAGEGQPWVQLYTHWLRMAGSSLSVDRDKNWYAAFASGGGLYASTDQGVNWTKILNSASTVTVDTHGTIFAGGTSYTYRSTDRGTNWTNLDTLKEGLLAKSFAFGSDGKVFAGRTSGYQHHSGGVFRSTDYGNTWTCLKQGLPNGDSASGLQWCSVNALAISHAGFVFAGTDSGLFRSTDDGEHWAPIGLGLPQSIWAFAAESDSMRPLYVQPQIKSLVVDAHGSIYIGYDQGVFCSSDEGVTWVPFLSGFCGWPMVKALALDPDGFLYAGTLLGTVYRSTNPTTSVSTPDATIASGWRLEQNYPNPFNPKTVVSCQLVVASNLKLVVYDLLGREVAVLLDEYKVPGTYRFEFDGAKFASGVYICRMTAGDYVKCRKMVLMK